MDVLVVSYVGELVCWGIESSIVVLGVFIQGINYFVYVGQFLDVFVVMVYVEGLMVDFVDVVLCGLVMLELVDVDLQVVVVVIVGVVDVLYGCWLFCVYVDLVQDGVEVVNGVVDWVCVELLWWIGLGDLLYLCVEV